MVTIASAGDLFIHRLLSSTQARAAKVLRDDRRTALIFMVCALVVYSASVKPIALIGKRAQSPQAHFASLARSFLSGRLDVTVTRDTRLSELVPREGKYYVVYPPMPAVLLMPWVFVFGEHFPTSALSIVLAALSAGLMYGVLRRIGFAPDASRWVTVLFAFGTGLWYHALTGSSWYLAHVVAVFFLLLTLFELYGRRRPLLIGLALGAATLSRLPVVLATPYFIFELLQDRRNITRKSTELLLGLGLFLAFYASYNWLRFGSVTETGHTLIPGIMENEWNRHGLFSLRYLPRNLYAMVFQPPALIHGFPFLVPSTFGMALTFATPALLLVFGAPRDRWTLALAAAALLVAIPGLLHDWPGATQFGYRFSLDYTPFLLILTARSLGQGVSIRARLLIILSCLISVWGVRYARWVEPQWLFKIREV